MSVCAQTGERRATDRDKEWSVHRIDETKELKKEEEDGDSEWAKQQRKAERAWERQRYGESWWQMEGKSERGIY